MGMKQTEIGEISRDWGMIKLEVPYSVIDGDRGVNYPSKNELKNSGYCVFLSANNVTKNGFSFARTQFVSEEKDKSLRNGKLEKSDIVLTTRGSIGFTGYFDDTIPYKNLRINSGMVILRRNEKSKLKQNFLYQLFQSSLVQNQIEMISFGSAQQQLTVSGINKINLVVPPENEQNLISEVLSDTDNLIQATEQLIDKKQQIKTATMQNLLTGKIRLAEFDSKQTKSSELGEIPSDWDVFKLKDISQVKSGGTPSTTNINFWNGNILWCTPTDISRLKGSKYVETTQKTISELGLQSSSAEILPKDSIVMTSRATIGECAITTTEMTTNQGFKNFICSNHVSNEYLYYLLRTQKQRLINLCSGSTFLEISTTQVRNFQVIVPKSKNEQISIAQILSDMDKEITALTQRLIKLNDIKQGLMQNLLTGKIRLTE